MNRRYRKRSRINMAPDSTFCGNFLAYKRSWVDGKFTPWYLHSTTPVVYTSSGRYKTVEHCEDYLHPGPPYRTGDLFHLVKGSAEGLDVTHIDKYERPLVSDNDYIKYVYEGGFTATYQGYVRYAGLTTDESTYSLEEAYRLPHLVTDEEGNRGYGKFAPGRPGVLLGQTFGEFHQIPMMLKQTAFTFYNMWKMARSKGRYMMYPKALANEWLNYQFGWVPFVNDLKDFYKTVKNMHTRIKRLREHNNKWEKRGGILSHEVTPSELYYSSTTSTALTPNSLFGVFRTTDHYLMKHRKTVSRVWFSAHYKYAWKDPGDFRWDFDMATKLLGLELTPSLVWELTPWSWLVDWCFDIGSYLRSVEAQSDYATKFAYVMGRTDAVDTFTTGLKLGGKSVDCVFASTAVRKERNVAHPLGFGLTDSNLSARQISILGALGLSRSKRWGSSRF